MEKWMRTDALLHYFVQKLILDFRVDLLKELLSIELHHLCSFIYHVQKSLLC